MGTCGFWRNLDQGRFHIKQHEFNLGRLARKPEMLASMQRQQYLSSFRIGSDDPSTAICEPDPRILAHEHLLGCMISGELLSSDYLDWHILQVHTNHILGREKVYHHNIARLPVVFDVLRGATPIILPGGCVDERECQAEYLCRKHTHQGNNTDTCTNSAHTYVYVRLQPVLVRAFEKILDLRQRRTKDKRQQDMQCWHNQDRIAEAGPIIDHSRQQAHEQHRKDRSQPQEQARSHGAPESAVPVRQIHGTNRPARHTPTTNQTNGPYVGSVAFMPNRALFTTFSTIQIQRRNHRVVEVQPMDELQNPIGDVHGGKGNNRPNRHQRRHTRKHDKAAPR